MYANLYEQIADAITKRGYIIIEHALQTQLVNKLRAVCSDESSFVDAAIVGSKEKLIDHSRRSTKIRWLDEDGGGAQSEYLAFCEGLRCYLNRHLFLGLNYYESHFAIYENGDFYEKHLDALKNSKNRVVTTVFYLDSEWSEDDGGELLIFGEDGEVLERVLPEAGKLVVFLSEEFLHEVLPTKRVRHSIAGWFRVDKRGVLA